MGQREAREAKQDESTAILLGKLYEGSFLTGGLWISDHLSAG